MKSFIPLAVLVIGLQDGAPSAPLRNAILKARETLRESLKEELAKPPAARADLPHRLIVAAGTEGEPAARAALLLEAIDRAAEADDLHVATTAFVDLRKLPGAWYSGWAKILELREKKDKPAGMAEAWFDLAIESLDADEYDLAVHASERAEAAALKRGTATLLEATKDLREAARRTNREFEAVRSHALTLQEDPANPAANDAMGRFYCFVRGRWVLGLSCLARGGDEALRGLVEADRVAREAQAFKIRAADRWWDWAEKQTLKTAKDGGRERAVYWYEQANDGILAPADRPRIEKRIRTFGESLPPGPGGNVALAFLGARIAGAAQGELLLDGVTEGYTGAAGHALSPLPAEWLVTLPRVYPLRQMRLLLWDNDDRFYRYTIETSTDGATFDLVVDRSQGQSRSWQILSFTPRLVRTIRIRGLYNSGLRFFHAVEFEAYCRPPPAAPKPK